MLGKEDEKAFWDGLVFDRRYYMYYIQHLNCSVRETFY